MLCTLDDVLAIPGMSNTPAIPTTWLNRLIGAADAHIKSWCKQNLEQAFYTEYHSGNGVRDVILRQSPVWLGQTTLASSMNGLTLPQSTINVASTTGFFPGLAGGTSTLNNPTPGISVQTGASTWAYVTYTGTTSTSFTGCSGGTGTLSSSSNNSVFSPVLWWDAGGYYGQAASAFAQTSQLALGSQYVLQMDSGSTRQLARRGLVRRIGGAGLWNVFSHSAEQIPGKLAARRMPVWPRGDGNIKVTYTAGWPSYSQELRELAYCCAMLVAQMVRIQPSGQNLGSESMGNYSYSAQQAFETPEMGEIRRVLAPYRESSWGLDA